MLAQRSSAARGAARPGHAAPAPRFAQLARRKARAAATVRAQAAAPAYAVQEVLTAAGRAPAVPSAPAELGCEVIQGALARFSDTSKRAPPTAVLVHGILGSRRNLQSFAHMLVEGFPAWQVLLVDLRCHGESAAAAGAPPPPGPHTVDSAAADVLQLLRSRRMFPQMLIGHSFGGKVVMSMARQFGVASLPRPVQVWVLDTVPGEARSGYGPEGDVDHPAALIATLKALRPPFASRADLIDSLTQRGFSLPIARWMTTNLRPAGPAPGDGLTWSFDLGGISDMYDSYESTELWDLLTQPPQGLKVDFVRATRSNFRWGGGAEDRIVGLGHRVHPLDAGHWVATENPQGLFDLMSHTFAKGGPDLHMQHAPSRPAAR